MIRIKNYEPRVVGRVAFLFLLTLFLCAVLPNLVSAHNVNDTSPSGFWAPGEPIVHCGGPNQSACAFCDLLHVLRHIIDAVLIFVTPVVGTLFFIIAGVMMMLGGDNPGLLSRGKSIFKSTFIGILIIFMAWLITNTLIQTLAASTITFSDGSVWTSDNWWEFNCDTSN